MIIIIEITVNIVFKGFGQHNLALKSGVDGGCDDKVAIIKENNHNWTNHHQGVVIHEMLHNLGVGHEQNRPDRDSLMTIDWTNIPIDKVLSLWSSWIDDKERF